MKTVGSSLSRNQAKVAMTAALVFLLGPSLLLAQRVVTFANTGTFMTTADRRVYDPTTCAPLVGTNWVAALYFGFTPDAITELAVRNFDDTSLLRAIGRFRDVDPSSPAAGTWSGGQRVMLGDITFGQTLTMQVRVWDLSQFATFDEARAMGGYALESAPFSYVPSSASDPFSMKLNNFMGITPPECVPEPSTFVLAGLGLAVLITFRRKFPKSQSPRRPTSAIAP